LLAATQKDGGISPDIVITRIDLSEAREKKRELSMGRSLNKDRPT
jgi:hypothetical protein